MIDYEELIRMSDRLSDDAKCAKMWRKWDEIFKRMKLRPVHHVDVDIKDKHYQREVFTIVDEEGQELFRKEWGWHWY